MAADVTIVMTGDQADLFRKMEKLEKKVAALEGRLKKVGKAGHQAGKEIQQGFGERASGVLSTYATRFISIAGAVGLVAKGLDAARRASDEAGKSISTTADTLRALLQISPSQVTFKQLEETVTRIRQTEGIGAQRASELVFSAGSAGILQDVDLFARLERIGFSPEKGVEAVQKIQANFGGQGPGSTGGGTSRQILNKVLAAAETSPIKATEFASAASVAATDFGAIGGQDESLLATLSALAIPFTTPKIAGQRIATLSAQVKKKRAFIDSDLTGLPLLQALPDLAEAGKLKSEAGGPQTLQKFLESIEAQAGLRQIILQRDVIATNLKAITAAEAATGGDKDLLGGRLTTESNSPVLVLDRARRQAEQREQVTNEKKLGNPEQAADALQLDLVQQSREKGGFATTLDYALSIRRFFEGSSTFNLNLKDQASPELKATFEQVEKINRENFRATQEIKKAADKMNQAAAAGERAAQRSGAL